MASTATTSHRESRIGKTPSSFLRSTWRRGDRSQWNLCHWFYEILHLHSTHINKPVPVHDHSAKVPNLSNSSLILWILIHGCLPVLFHHVYIFSTGRPLSIWGAGALYIAAMTGSALRAQSQLRHFSHTLGFLDGRASDRPDVPDTGVKRVFYTLNALLAGRCWLMVLMAYSNHQSPADVAWHWLLLKMAAYSITFDFWFYWYHLSMHKIPFLRKHHRIHHLSTHPSTLMTAFSNGEQSLFDYIVLPLATFFVLNKMGISISFYEWYICNLQGFMTEMGGHSGLRMHACTAHPLAPLFKQFNCDLSIEDHDLHHRHGWRNSGNYGTQTRLWDAVFGTRKDRLETRNDNVDWDNVIYWPVM